MLPSFLGQQRERAALVCLCRHCCEIKATVMEKFGTLDRKRSLTPTRAAHLIAFE